MLQNTNYQTGFTLLELLVAITIIGALSLVSVQSLWDTLSSRSEQYRIENSTAIIRPIFSILTQAIESSSQLSISGSQIKIWGSPCKTIELSAGRIKQSIDTSVSCSPPANGTIPMTPDPALKPSLVISSFVLTTPSSNNVVNISIGITYKDLFRPATIYATTSAVRRSL